MPSITRRQILAAGLGTLATLKMPALAQEPKRQLLRRGDPHNVKVTHSAKVTNGKSVMQSLEMWLPVPVSQPTQTIAKVALDPKVPVYDDVNGLCKVAKLFIDDNLPGENESRSMTLTYEASSLATRTDPDLLGNYPYKPYRQDKQYELMTRPEEKIESNIIEIKELAAKFKGKRRSAVSIARDVFDWVVDHLDYKRLETGISGAKFCLQKKHGECGDYSGLFVALCRAAGVPARPVPGFWANDRNSWHVWAEFLLPTGEWIPVDPSLAEQSDRFRKLYFGNMDNQRIALCTTYDVELKGVKEGAKEISYLQAGAWWWYAKKIDGLPTASFDIKVEKA